MNDLPRKQIEPLSPPTGELERVLARARYRRHRRAFALLTVAVVFVAGLGGGFALGRDVPRDVAAAVTSLRDDVSGASKQPPLGSGRSRAPQWVQVAETTRAG